jgi:hypothetical protein
MSADTVNETLCDCSEASSTHPHLCSTPSTSDPALKTTAMSTSPSAQNGLSTDTDKDRSTKAPPPKILNVWNIRKEQMARTKAAASTSSPVHTSTSHSPTRNHHPNHHPAPSIPITVPNGSDSDPIDDDPFVVRPNRTPYSATMRLESSEIRVTIPPSASMPVGIAREDWPEVGKGNHTGEHVRGTSGSGEHAGKASIQRKGELCSSRQQFRLGFGAFSTSPCSLESLIIFSPS